MTMLTMMRNGWLRSAPFSPQRKREENVGPYRKSRLRRAFFYNSYGPAIVSLILATVAASPAEAGGGVSAASSASGHALSGAIRRLPPEALKAELEAARAESERLAARDATLRQAIIAVRIIKIVAKIAEMGLKPLAGMPPSQVDVMSLSLDIALLADELDE